MFTKIAPVALLSAAAFAAPAPAPEVEERGLLSSVYCLAQNIVINALAEDAKASAFCSSALNIPIITSTATAQVAGATVTNVITSTVTKTTTGAQATSTCAPQYANGNSKRGLLNIVIGGGAATSSTKATTTTTTTKAASSAVATPACLNGLAAAVISADCQCLNLPTSTTTITVTSTKAPVTVTSTTVSTTIAVAQATSTASQLYDLSGTYVAKNQAKFQLYPNLDFPSNDAFQGTCGEAGDVVTTSDGTFKCESWNDCMDICATASWGCKGVSFVPSWNFCYLKSAVPGNGVANCGVVQAEVVQSGLNIAQGNSYAVSS